jgi:hypothetical protein
MGFRPNSTVYNVGRIFLIYSGNIHINTYNIVINIWRHASFTGGGRPLVPFCTVFQAQAGT